MTREEAIKRLEVVRTNALIQKANGASEYWQEEIDGTIEAIDMAIEALSVANLKSEFESAEYEDYEHATLVDIKEPLKVLVVRCKDCIHWKADNEVFELGFCCVFPQKWVAETFYCADGERRE